MRLVLAIGRAGRGWASALALLVVGGAVADPAVAQTVSGGPTGTVVGRVLDESTLAPLDGVAIVVHPGERTATSGADGRFGVEGLPVGTYRIELHRIGYEPFVQTDVIVRPSRITTLELTLGRAAIRLEALEVRPSYFSEPDRSAGSETSFSAEEIRRAPGSAGDVSRIVMSLPSLAKVNDQSNGLIVRGGSPMENAFIVDGIAVPNINHFPLQGTSGGPIGVLNVDLIRDVQFHTGGFPVRYGDRLSSVMEIDLREGNRDEFDAQFDMGLAGFGGVAEGPLPRDAGSWVVSARRSYLDLVVKAFDVGATIAPRYGDYQGKVVADLSSRHKLAALGVWSDDHMLSDLTQARENAMLYFGRQDDLTGTTGVSWWALWNDRLHSRTSLAFTLQRFDEDNFETASDRLLLRNRTRERAITLRNNNGAALGALDVQFGVEAARVWSVYDNLYGAHLGPLGDSIAELALNGEEAGVQAGVYAAGTYRPLPPLSVTVGARAEHFSLTSNTTLSPRAAVSYRLGARTTLLGSAGIFRQHLPLVLLSQSPVARALPDPMATHYVVGITHLLSPATRLSAEAYRKDYRRLPVDPSQRSLFPIDEIYYDYGVFTARDSLLAEGRAYSMGLEVVVQKRLARDVYGLASAGYSRSRYRGLDGVWRDRVFDNRLVFSVEGGYKPSSGWEFSARWIFAGGPPYTPIDTAASHSLGRTVFDETRINDARYPDYHSLNLRVDRRFNWQRRSLIVYLSVWNAYDRKNVATYYWNTETNATEPIRQWGMLPLFGLELEF